MTRVERVTARQSAEEKQKMPASPPPPRPPYDFVAEKAEVDGLIPADQSDEERDAINLHPAINNRHSNRLTPRHRTFLIGLTLFSSVIIFHGLFAALAPRGFYNRCCRLVSQTNSSSNEQPAVKTFPPWSPQPACNVTQTTSQAVQGHFDLYDCLEIRTASGSVDISVTPHASTGSHDTPSTLRVYSAAGSVQIRLADQFVARAEKAVLSQRQQDPLSDNDVDVLRALDRPFDTEIATAAGSVSISYVVGNGGQTDISSVAGQLTANLFAVNVGPEDPLTKLSTQSTSGSQDIRLSSFTRLGSRVSNLRASHTCIGSASIDVAYPTEWEGTVDATVWGSAAVAVQGNDLEFEERSAKHIRAHRGNGKSLVDLVVFGSATVDFQC